MSILRRQLLCPSEEGISRRLWLWKAILLTVPFHALYLAGIFWLDRAVPQLMTKAAVFIPVVGVGFALESVAMQPLIDRFKPPEAG